MLVCVLASGSGGNAIYIESRGTALLVDQGLSHRELIKRMSLMCIDINKIKAILVSHEHTDHVYGAGKTSRDLGIPIFATTGTLNGMNKHLKGDENIIAVSGSETFKIESFEITPFSVSHDAIDPVQFCVVSGRKKVSVATDLGFVSNLVVQRLNGSDIVIIESNYDIEMLKKGSYPWELKQRIMGKRGHLSNKNASELVFNISQNGTKKVVLAHLSRENNMPEIAERTIREIFEQYDKKMNSLTIALQDEPTDVFEI